MAKRYLATYSSLLLLGLISTFGLNWLIDPLWYGKGNHLSARNFPFDERSSKTNLFLHSDPKRYDCVIFGSSRATMLNNSDFQENCFNYAFSGSSIEEYIPYAKFVAKHNPNIKKVYLGIDPFNFKQSSGENNFSVKRPGSIIRSYLSFDLLMFSLKSVTNPRLGARFYNSQKNFESETFDDWPAYQPSFDVRRSDQSCDRDKVNRYRELRNVFPQAEFVGYAAPVSSWYVVNQLYAYGDVLDCYLEATHQLSQEFTAVYDFTIPSSITEDPSKSYNGDHYYRPVVAMVAQVIQGKNTAASIPSDFGLRVNDYSLNSYKAKYFGEIHDFLQASDRADLWQGDELRAQTHRR